jgi:hypothetical protein
VESGKNQSADVTSVRSAVQPPDGGACREQARHRRVALVEDKLGLSDRERNVGIAPAGNAPRILSAAAADLHRRGWTRACPRHDVEGRVKNGYSRVEIN